MNHSFAVKCPCGCESVATATDKGFAATTVDVEACPASLLGTVTVRKSWAYSHAAPVTGLRHTDGLVVFG